MPKLTLTDFIDIVGKPTPQKITKIQQIKNRSEYTPAMDFYKQLKEGIIHAHKDGLGQSHLKGLMAGLTNTSKLKRYPPLIDEYLRWWGKRTYTWQDPPSGSWKHGKITINVTPELGLIHKDKLYVIKLYFKSERITGRNMTIVQYLMQKVLPQNTGLETIMAVHEVGSGKLIDKPPDETRSIEAQLCGEAAMIQEMWDML